MNDFNRCKISGVRWLKKPVEDIQIKVKLKPQDGVLSLPKFEEYTNESSGLNLEKLENKAEEYTFKWQEKVFSQWEIQRYSDIHNCITENDLNYNEVLKNLDYEPSKIFTYIHEDYHLPLPMELKKKENLHGKVQSMTSCFDKLGVNENMGKMLCMLGDTSSTGHLFRSTENISSEEEPWAAMHIAFDHSDYNEESKLLLKQESTLLSLYHNSATGCLIMSPEVNDLELTPYSIEMDTGLSLGYVYSVDVVYEESNDEEGLVNVLRKLYEKWEHIQRQMVTFEMPPIGKKQFLVTFEVLTATDFDMDNLYVEFDIKIPEELKCNDPLHGRTHVAKYIRKDEIEEWNYGHIIELHLEIESDLEPPSLQFFFEVISTDWWGRHRTEGYAYLPLTLTPGYHSKQLSCSRPEEIDSTEADSRRFFVGGCHLIRDFDVLVNPQLIDTNYKFTSTGRLNLRWNVIAQAPLPGTLPKHESYSGRSATALLLGAEAVLRQYRKARARLAAATEGLAQGDTKETSAQRSGDIYEGDDEKHPNVVT